MGLQLAIGGMKLAIDAIGPSDPDLAAVRTSEAVIWADVASDLVPDARHRLSPALSMTRNAVLHGAIVCGDVRDGVTWPLRWPLAWIDVVWAPTHTILNALNVKPSAAKVRDYEQHLAGQRVIPVLTDVLDHFTRLAGV